MSGPKNVTCTCVKMAVWRAGLSVVLGSAVIGGVLSRKNTLSKKDRVHATSLPVRTEQQKWDPDWDCRGSKAPSEQSDQQMIPKATRVLIMVRHGQYNLKGEGDTERFLTDLGKEQAHVVGKRLKEMEPSLGYAAIHQSTMTRAMETCSIISKYLCHIPVKTDAILCEGPPIRPDPPSPHWRPESHVSSLSVCAC